MQQGVSSIAAAGVLAATAALVPVISARTPLLPAVHAPAVDLTASESSFDALQSAQLDFNGTLINTELAANAALVHGEALADAPDAADRILNALVNMPLDTLENTFNGLLGANADVTKGVSEITSSLILGNPDLVFNAGNIGGLTGVETQLLAASSLLTGVPSEVALEQIQDHLLSQSFNSVLDNAHGVVAAQLQLEQTLFGSTDALNGAVNRGFNAYNMFLDAFANSIFGLGGTHPDVAEGVSELTQALIVGNPDLVFNAGNIGGLEGVFDQSLAALVDLVSTLGI